MLGNFRERHRKHVSHVHREVHDCHHEDAEHHGPGYVAAWVLHLARHPGDVHPPVIRKEDRDEPDSQSGDQLARAHAHRDAGIPSVLREVRPTPLADQETQEHERSHGNEFGPSREILQDGTAAQSDHVDPGDDHDGDQPYDVGTSQRDSGCCENHMVLRNRRENGAQIRGRGH